MSKKRFTHDECPVARSLDQIGDWWTLLIVREMPRLARISLN